MRMEIQDPDTTLLSPWVVVGEGVGGQVRGKGVEVENEANSGYTLFRMSTR